MHRSSIDAPNEKTQALLRSYSGGSGLLFMAAKYSSGARQMSWHSALSYPFVMISQQLLPICSRSQSMTLTLDSLRSTPIKICANLILLLRQPIFYKQAQAGMVQKMTSAISLVVKSIFLSSRLLYYFLRDSSGYSKTMVNLDVFFNNPSTLFP